MTPRRRGTGDPAARHFEASDSERAAFEAGIKLGAIHHQFLGAAIGPGGVAAMERAIEQSVRVQPFVTSVRVTIRLPRRRPRSPYHYESLSSPHLEAKVVVVYGRARAVGRLRWDRRLGYPLMSVVVRSSA